MIKNNKTASDVFRSTATRPFVKSFCFPRVYLALLALTVMGCFKPVIVQEVEKPLKTEIKFEPYITLPSYDVSLPAYPVAYSEEEKTEQRKAGATTIKNIKSQIASGQKHLVIPKGIYRYGLK
ncbi:MAG: hypothetical protein NTU80_10365 [Verrucomicrobia bacterium]|nr:hypothetical protein [Verrucomicrobiota bacterium]